MVAYFAFGLSWLDRIVMAQIKIGENCVLVDMCCCIGASNTT